MKKIIQKFYNTISYWKFDESLPQHKDSIVLLNQYIFLLFLFFLIQTIFNVLFVGNYLNVVLLFCISLFFFFCFLFFRNFLINKYYIFLLFIGLTFVVTFYSSYYGVKSGTFLYYFPLISAVFIFFSWKDERFFILSLIVIILFNLYISAISDFEIFAHNKNYQNFGHHLLIVNITCMLIVITLNLFWFIQKREEYYFTLNRNLYKKEQIENLSNEIERLKRSLNKEVFSEEILRELIDSLQLNDVYFIEKFEVIFPDFFETVNRISGNILNISDLKMCAMLKLGFTSKQIAIYTNSSIKSVEGKIYRLRKKLNLHSDIDSKVWFSKLY